MRITDKSYGNAYVPTCGFTIHLTILDNTSKIFHYMKKKFYFKINVYLNTIIYFFKYLLKLKTFWFK